MKVQPRARISEGVTRQRLETEAKRSVRPTGVFVAGCAVALAIALFLLVHISPTLGQDTRELRIEVSSAFGIFEGFDDVRFRGVPAGTIERIERDGDQLVLVASLDTSYGPVYRDARAEVRPTTPLNDVYLDIVDPGTPAAGEVDSSTPLPEARTQTSVTVPEVLDTLRADERAATRRLLDGLGNGMRDGGTKLRRAFVAAAPLVEHAGELAEQIARRRSRTERVVHNVALLTEELGRREETLRDLVGTGAAAFGAIQQSSGALDATLRELAPTVTELRATLRTVSGITDDVDEGLTSLLPVADELGPALTALDRLSDDLGPAARDLAGPVDALRRWVNPVEDVAAQGWRLSQALRPEVPTLDELTQRLVECEDGIIGFFQWNASLSKFGDENGPIPRGNLTVGVPAVGLPGEELRSFEQSCTPGTPVRGVPTEKDFG